MIQIYLKLLHRIPLTTFYKNLMLQYIQKVQLLGEDYHEIHKFRGTTYRGS